MKKRTITLKLILLCSLVSILCCSVVYSQGESYPILGQHSFEPPFLLNYGTGSIPNWEYGGSSLATENFIRLVPAMQSRTGYMYNTQPVQSKSWRVDMRFQIHNTHSHGADGIGFWYIERPERTSGPLYGQKDYFKGLGIIFDTYDNNANGDGPSVIAIQGEGSQNVKWDIDNDLLANQLDRCRADFRNAIGGIVTARISYKYNELSVDVDTVGSGKFSKCLQVRDLDLPTGYYFMLTAATGGLADYHDIYSFVTYETSGQPNAYQGVQDGDGDSHRDEHKRHGWYDPYAYWKNEAEKEENQQQQPQQQQQQNTDKQARRQQRKQQLLQQPSEFFETLKKKLKDFKPRSKDSEMSVATETNLLILEALEEITRIVRDSSTKEDIDNIVKQIDAIAIKQRSLQAEIKFTKDNLKKDMRTIIDSLNNEASNLHSGLKKLDTYLNAANNQITDLSDKHRKLESGLEGTRDKLFTTINDNGDSTSWIVIIIIMEILSVVVFLFIKSRRDSNNNSRKRF